MDVIEELLKKLEILSNIKEGQTISTYGTLAIIEHNAWSTTFWRQYAGENRQKTVNYIKGVLDDAMEHIDNIVVRNLVVKAMTGIVNLKVTYKADVIIVAFIDTMLNSYHALLEPVSSDSDNNILNVNGEVLEVSTEFDDLGDNLGEKYEVKESEDIGVTFLSNVLKKDYVQVEKYLYDGYNVNVTTSDGKNALHLICDGIYDFPMLKLLYSFHIDSNYKDMMGKEPIYYATKGGWTEAVLFLKQNADKKKLATRV